MCHVHIECPGTSSQLHLESNSFENKHQFCYNVFHFQWFPSQILFKPSSVVETVAMENRIQTAKGDLCEVKQIAQMHITM